MGLPLGWAGQSGDERLGNHCSTSEFDASRKFALDLQNFVFRAMGC